MRHASAPSTGICRNLEWASARSNPVGRALFRSYVCDLPPGAVKQAQNLCLAVGLAIDVPAAAGDRFPLDPLLSRAEAADSRVRNRGGCALRLREECSSDGESSFARFGPTSCVPGDRECHLAIGPRGHRHISALAAPSTVSWRSISARAGSRSRRSSVSPNQRSNREPLQPRSTTRSR